MMDKLVSLRYPTFTTPVPALYRTCTCKDFNSYIQMGMEKVYDESENGDKIEVARMDEGDCAEMETVVSCLTWTCTFTCIWTLPVLYWQL